MTAKYKSNSSYTEEYPVLLRIMKDFCQEFTVSLRSWKADSVDMDDAILICVKDRAQDVKYVADCLKE